MGGHPVTVEADAPPIGLAEDEAYTPSIVTRLLATIAISGSFIICLMLVLQGGTILGKEVAAGTWDFWGNTDLLGIVFILSGLVIGVGGYLALQGKDTSLVLSFLGILLFEVVMMVAVLRTPDASTRFLFFLVMLAPFFLLLVYQVESVRFWLFESSRSKD